MADTRRPVGLIVNPLAGIGGRVGLKGSDGLETVRKAFERGAEPAAPGRAVETLRALEPLAGEIELVTYPAEMGEDEARACGFEPVVLGTITSGQTTAEDTRQAARDMLEYGVELLLFVGGDGTARDVYAAIGQALPVLGIPAGVNMHSSVYAVTPRRAAELAAAYLNGRADLRDVEVMDIDEDAFREGRVSARLYGYLKAPYEEHLLQGAKVASGGGDSPAGLAEHVIEDMDDEHVYVLGPGTTVHAIGEALGIDKTLLGVDVVYRGELIGKDVGERELLDLLAGRPAKIVVTIIGGQGYIFGRGNQQISPAVIRQVGPENIIVVATPDKLRSINGPLLVDTGDPALDRELAGYIRVVTGYRQMSLRKVE